MTLKPFEHFSSFKTHHCVTGSMRHIYAFNKCDISEDLLLGLGEGVGFMYWSAKGQPPFLGGRASPKQGMETVAGLRTGVRIEAHTSSSSSRSRQVLLEMLTAGQPVMLQVDMGFLPYFDFGGQEYHFGGHVVVACGYAPDTGEILIADRDGLYPVPLVDLERARCSTFKPFPPKNGWWTFDFTGFQQPTAEATRQAVANQAARMLNPPIRNFGIAGIRTAAERIPRWPEQLSTDEIRSSLFNIHILVSPIGGSGGGNFRYMLSRFLAEAAAITGKASLIESSAEFKRIGDSWESFANWAKSVSQSPDPSIRLGECTGSLLGIADQEQHAWEGLL